MATYNDVRQQNQTQQEQQPFTAEGAIQMRRAEPVMADPGLEMGAVATNQAAQQGLGLPNATQLAEGILQGTVTEQDLASVPQGLASDAMALVQEFTMSQAPQSAVQPQGLY